MPAVTSPLQRAHGVARMATFLFAWNPKYWNWPELAAQRRVLAKKGYVDVQWASGATRQIESGSRAFMVRLGVPPKGLIGAGSTMTAPVEGPHWREDRKLKRTTTLHLWIRFDTLFDAPVVTMDDLAVPPYSRFRWATRASGVRIPSNVADAAETLWERKVAAFNDAAKRAKIAGAKRASGPR
jgi:5-methylcytosine-specific restriction protein A